MRPIEQQVALIRELKDLYESAHTLEHRAIIVDAIERAIFYPMVIDSVPIFDDNAAKKENEDE